MVDVDALQDLALRAVQAKIGLVTIVLLLLAILAADFQVRGLRLLAGLVIVPPDPFVHEHVLQREPLSQVLRHQRGHQLLAFQGESGTFISKRKADRFC